MSLLVSPRIIYRVKIELNGKKSNESSHKLNLRHLRTFCDIADTGSSRLTADRLFLAPAAVSMQLSQLEDELGGKLFNRSTRPMSLTALGQFVYPKAKELLTAADRLFVETRNIAAGSLGWLGIGFTRSTIFSVVPESVRKFQNDNPNVHIELVEILTEHQASALRNGSIHLGLSRVLGPFAKEPDLEYIHLFDDPLVAALPLDHPLSQRDDLKTADLEGLPFISFPKDASSHFSQQVLLLLQQAGARPKVVHEAKEIHTALGLVAAGQGTTVVGKSVSFNNRPDIRFIPISDLAIPSKVLAVRKADQVLPLVDDFLAVLRTRPKT